MKVAGQFRISYCVNNNVVPFPVIVSCQVNEVALFFARYRLNHSSIDDRDIHHRSVVKVLLRVNEIAVRSGVTFKIFTESVGRNMDAEALPLEQFQSWTAMPAVVDEEVGIAVAL